jgi:gas vesicle protein
MKKGLGFLTGLVFGGLAGAGAALLLAPRPGAETRRLIRDQVETARDQAALSLDEARYNAERAVQDAGHKVEQLQRRGRLMWRRNVNRLQESAAAVKASAREAVKSNRPKPVAEPSR